MPRLFVALFTSLLLVGCVQPQMDKPMANGAYLVIDQGQAWAVLVLDGRRIEEPGELLDMQKLTGEHSQITASYVVETANCGRLQWLTERGEDHELATRVLAFDEVAASRCTIAQGLSRSWTALDYSS